MSFASQQGEQVEPDELRPRLDDDPAQLTDDELHREVVVRFADAVTRMTPGELCDRLGITYADWHESMVGLVDTGWLTPQPDGSYAATVPDDGEEA